MTSAGPETAREGAAERGGFARILFSFRPEEVATLLLFAPMAYALGSIAAYGGGMPLNGPTANYPDAFTRLVGLVGSVVVFLWVVRTKPEWTFARDVLPFLFAANVYVNLHDMIAFDFPNPEVSLVTRAITSAIIRGTARGARALLTDSEDAAESILRHIDIARSRITHTPLAASTPRPVDHQTALDELRVLGVPSDRPFLLATGNRLPHKNFAGLLRAVARIDPSVRPQVVITGSHGQDPLSEVVEDLGLSSDVHLLGWVTQSQLEALYGRAALYVCPSLAEGFGLPVLDAMARGVPVLANDIAVLREVGASAAAYADATSPPALASAITRLIGDESGRATMREAGFDRAALFSWDRTAELTLAVLHDLLLLGRATPR